MIPLIELDAWINQQQKHFEDIFSYQLPHNDIRPSKLHSAIRYATLDGGKRIRPSLIFATGEDLCIHNVELLNQLAVVIESIHAYSLIHDDLPSMDNDDLRRGKPSCHIAFNEGEAILAGDSLQAWAFGRLAKLDIDSDSIVQLITVLSDAIGPEGMAQGQALDLAYEEEPSIDIEQLSQLHWRKTGMLIQACILMPAIATQQTSLIEAFKAFGHHLGLAFQIQDDILDVTASSDQLGKPANSDLEQNKKTFPSILGLEEAIKHRDHQLKLALSVLMPVKLHKGYLASLAYHCIHREN